MYIKQCVLQEVVILERKLEDTLTGKLPQRKITTEAAHGYSSYGNQIGLATGQVAEVYDEGFVAKRMEIGAVIGAVPKENVIREVPSSRRCSNTSWWKNRTRWMWWSYWFIKRT